MFKLENLNQINDLNYGPISRGNKYKYIIINESNDNKKYEIGKRYKQDIVFYNDLFDMSSHKFLKLKGFKIMEIKTFDTSTIFENIVNDFKIVREINYLNLLNSDDVTENMISAIKNHEEIILNAFLDSKEIIYLKFVINSGVYKYSNKIITEYMNGKSKYENLISFIIKKYGRNKDLNYFIKYGDCFIQDDVLSIGRPQDLNLIKSEIKISNAQLKTILNHGRKKDIDYYSMSNNHAFDDTLKEMIIRTYNDDFIDDCIKIYYDDFLLMEYIVKYANKKQLDILVKHDNYAVRLAVAKREYKEHLEKLINDPNEELSELVSKKLKKLNRV